jgi:hypothetical protein
MRKLFAIGWLAVVANGCSLGGSAPASGSSQATAFASPTALTARLLDPSNIQLTWKNNASEDCWNWVEFTTPGSEWVKLAALPVNETTFQHPDVAPETKHIYRIQPFFGRATPPISIMTGRLPPGTTNVDEEGPLPPLPTKDDGPKALLRHLSSIAAAAPADLTAVLSSPTTVDLRWKDRAKDEDGFVVEVGPGAMGPFQVCALLDPNTTSFRKTLLPPEFKVYFRVRAFFYGKPSTEATVTTPAEGKK